MTYRKSTKQASFLILTILLFVAVLVQQNVVAEVNTQHLSEDKLSQTITAINGISPNTHDSSISISNDTDLANQGFNGSGTEEDPYRIEDLHITDTNLNSQIFIEKTSLYILIENVTVSNGENGIFLNDVGNVTINNSSISMNSKHGVKVINSTNIHLNDSNVYENGNGICGFAAGLGLSGHTGSGAYFDPSSMIEVTLNHIFDNFGDGLVIHDTEDVTVENNFIKNNGKDCPELYSNLDTVHINHTVGIGIFGINWTQGIVQHNNITENAYYGIVLDPSSASVQIQFNNFKDNANGQSVTSQGYDSGDENIFNCNYYSDYNQENDGNTYDIDGGTTTDTAPQDQALRMDISTCPSSTTSTTITTPTTTPTTTETSEKKGLLDFPMLFLIPVMVSLAIIMRKSRRI